MDELQLAAGGGTIGIAFYFLSKAIMSLVEKIKNGKEVESTISLDQWNGMENKINSLYDMHNKHDQEGIPVWYVRRVLYEELKELNNTMQIQGQLINGLIDKFSELRNELRSRQ